MAVSLQLEKLSFRYKVTTPRIMRLSLMFLCLLTETRIYAVTEQQRALCIAIPALCPQVGGLRISRLNVVFYNISLFSGQR